MLNKNQQQISIFNTHVETVVLYMDGFNETNR